MWTPLYLMNCEVMNGTASLMNLLSWFKFEIRINNPLAMNTEILGSNTFCGSMDSLLLRRDASSRTGVTFARFLSPMCLPEHRGLPYNTWPTTPPPVGKVPRRPKAKFSLRPNPMPRLWGARGYWLHSHLSQSHPAGGCQSSGVLCSFPVATILPSCRSWWDTACHAGPSAVVPERHHSEQCSLCSQQ